ncbi:hypothetical protein M231_07350 [Tremella mesenterica]|uniref:Uncharacterized protein n=1 Tax=Tremella mesenterica TaxID=5217 RepID=A0A4Q1BC86_TREME|nr:hypothetical protein M231_07350 [Tremella mesenterica]
MSVSSETTVISPSAHVHHALSRTNSRSQTQLTSRNTTNGHVRRTSGHGQIVHHATTKKRVPSYTNLVAHGAQRRSSDGESGRRAVVAGLTMHALERPSNPRKSSSDRLPGKASRSDTHLPKLARTLSATSTHSIHSSTSGHGQDDKRNHSKEDSEVQPRGKDASIAGKAEEESWEEEDEEVKVGPVGNEKPRTMTEKPRDVAKHVAQVNGPTGSVDSPIVPVTPHSLHGHQQTRRTTGWTGNVTVPDPSVIPPPHPFTFPSPDPAPEVILKHIPSTKELTHAAVESERRRASSRAETLRNEARMPERSNSTEGSGLPHPVDSRVKPGSTDFPFPSMSSAPSSSQPPSVLEKRSRVASDRPLRQKMSNSSLRSMQSLRAPPHPLNSPVSARATQPTVSTSRPGSMFGSPNKNKQAQPYVQPVPPPVIYPTVVQGESWNIPEDREMEPGPSMNRRESVASISSTRSLRQIFTAAQDDRQRPSQQIATSRRLTALQAAAAASKWHTTNDPALYHQSLGYPSTLADTAHLISRFLPVKKSKRPAWEIPAGAESSKIGVQNGDYREAHESLVRTMRELGMGGGGSSRRVSRNPSHMSLLSDHGEGGGVHGTSGVGSVKGLVVARGGWRGKTPFELSVERCLAQRPRYPGQDNMH